MAGSGEEIQALRKRLKAVEGAINELRQGDLALARAIGSFLCTIEFNMAIRFYTGEELAAYGKVLSPKLESARKEIAASKTVDRAFEIFLSFDKELGDYLKATKVKTAAEAMDIAHSFIKKYVPVALPMKAVKEGDVWLVDIDVGALAVKVAKVKVDARTGDILSYEIPEK